MRDEAKRELDTAVGLFQGLFPYVRAYSDMFLAYLDADRQTVAKLLPDIEAHVRESGSSLADIAGYYMYLGDREKGFALLERSYSDKEPGLLTIALSPNLDDVRTDPRYLDLLKRLGLNKTAQIQ